MGRQSRGVEGLMVVARMGGERGEEKGEQRWRGRKEGGSGGDGDAGGHQFLDRSRVRILLCENDPKSSQEVLQLLLNCSYQVTSVRSARQVIDVLNAQGPEIDIILAEIELPMTKGLKMLKYIMRNKDLRHIPIIIMSAQDEVSVVVKCLRLGAADYLMKPLRTNELLNLWIHMWRRRCTLGLTEKDVLSHNFEIQFSDPSDANTNSTTLISDDTDYRPSTVPNSKLSKLNYPECESHVSPAVHACNNPLHGVQHIPRDCDHAGVMDQNIIPTPEHLFQCSLNDLQGHSSPALPPHFVPHIPLMPSFPYQTFGINLQSSHMAASAVSSSMTSSPMLEVQSGRIEKRAAALIKFRQKRKDRCFDKKIRYLNRKHLAEKRPRVRGQFVKQVINVDLNQNVLGGGDGDLGDDEDDEPTLKELELISSPEQNAPD
ncbi:Two-component response regulator-like, partial [Musa troglodytarum]